jgi:predicted DNA binding CopG/RHH family protein
VHPARLQASADSTVLKTGRVNIRLAARDLEGLQARAAEVGIPYQTLMASVLHKFVSGRLIAPEARTASRSTRTSRKRAGV